MLDANQWPTLEIAQIEDIPSIIEFFNVLSDEAIYQYIPAPPPIDVTEFIKRHAPQPTKLVFGAYLAPKRTSPVGLLEFRLDGQDVADIGFLLGNMYWGRGYASKIIERAVLEVQSQLDINAFRAEVDSRNIGSIKALEKNLFVKTEVKLAMLKFQATEDYVFYRKIQE